MRLGLRLGASGSPPLPVSPRDLSPSAPLLPLSERTPLLEFCNVPGAGALLDVCKNSWSGRPSSFFPNSRSGRPSPILLSSRCGRPSLSFAQFPERTPLLAFCKLPERTPLPSQCLQRANRHSGVCEKNLRAYSAERKVQLPPRPQLQCWTSDATHGRAEAGVFFAAPQRPPAATTTLNLGVRGSLRQCA